MALDHGSDALVVFGRPAGRDPNDDEKRDCCGAVKEAANGRGQIIAGTGTYDRPLDPPDPHGRGERRRRGPDRHPVLQPASPARPDRHFTAIASPAFPSSSTTSPATVGLRDRGRHPAPPGRRRPQHRGRQGRHRRLPDRLAHRGREPARLRGLLGRRLGHVPDGGARRQGRDLGGLAPRRRAHARHGRADRGRRRFRRAQDPRRADAPVPRPVHRVEPDPAEGRPRDGGTQWGRPAAAGSGPPKTNVPASARRWSTRSPDR